MKIYIYDTTLRDGTQAEEVNLSTWDKIRIAKKLDEFGVDYIEGGWPSSNPTDEQFFYEIKNYQLKNSKIVAFGSTHNPRLSPEKDDLFLKTSRVGTDVITIFGKTWDLQVREALETSLENNLKIIKNSISYLRPKVKELIFDAEHFFDGFKENKEYALACIEAAKEAGADVIVLCDTNGGTLTHEIFEIVSFVKEKMGDIPLGIHCHNDSELAVANSIAAVRAGVVHVQGTINGYGERCGNANLCSIIPNLELKLGYKCIPEGNLSKLTEVARFVAEVANLSPFKRQPYVGSAAFTHKGGVHVSAVLKNPRCYEHIPPEKVGNRQRVVLSDLAGKSNILFKAKEYGISLDKDDPVVSELLYTIKELEAEGYEFSVADASFELLLNRALGRVKRFYTFLSFRVMDTKRSIDKEPITEATVMIEVGGKIEHTAATGKGPVNALDNALRKGLEKFYPNLKEMKLMDFKVRVLTPRSEENGGTASRVRVLIESRDNHSQWTTLGVSHNIIEASWQALVDSIDYKLFKDDIKRQRHEK